MGRPREFDEEVVLEKAAEAFWAHGYEATSVADLEAATGLAKGSLYKAFNGKHDLFMRALDRYLSAGKDRLRTRLKAASTGARGIEEWLHTIAEMATTGSVRRGCFGVNCTVERAPSDPEVRARLVRHERETEALYSLAVQRGVDEGDFREDLDPIEAARYINGVIHGLQVLGKSSLDGQEAKRIVRLALHALR